MGAPTSQLRTAPGKHSLSNFVQESSILRGQSQSSLRSHLPLPSCTRRVSFIWDFAQVIVPGRPTKVLDFSDVTRVGVTPARNFYHAGYSAPEMLKKDPADVRSDIYAVGALLFHAVGGKPIAETGVELMAWEPETPLAGVPQILGRCLGDKDTTIRLCH